jgi:methyl-accepting chemotaxis protein
MRLSKKIPVLILGAAAVTSIGVGVSSYFTAVDNLTDLTQQRLEAAATAGMDQTLAYLNAIESQLILTAEQPGVVAAVQDFTIAWDDLVASGLDPQAELLSAYITDNPNPTGQKDQLYDAGTGSVYDATHARYHPWFHSLQQDAGYYDVFLFDTRGNLIYSVFKELDYATNFRADGGEWSSTDLGVVFREAVNITQRGDVSFTDFAPYGPSYDAPASFMSHPVRNSDGSTIGVLAFQMPIDRINELMRHDLGLGQTGELALIGEDRFMRNDTAYTPDVNDILATRLENPVIEQAFQTGSSFGYGELHRGERMDIQARRFEYQGKQFAIIAMQADAEAVAPITAMRNQMIIAGGGLLALVALGGVFAARTITRPITGTVTAMNQLAAGDTKVQLQGLERPDEIGDMVRSVEVFKDNAVQRLHLEERARNDRDRERQRQAFLETLIRDFQNGITDRLATVGNQMRRMQQAATTLDELANNATSQSEQAGSAAQRASENVSAVAGATEEMTATVQEITNQTEATIRIVAETVGAAEATNQNVATLSDAAERIGSIVSLIRDIAEQTNLLALNATIEAARAGEAGRGFAVVASEVKELAEQTSKATDEISGQITGIQNSVRDAAGAIGNIAVRVSEIRDLTGAVAVAVEEQRSANQEIARSAKAASDSTEAASGNMTSVSIVVTKTSEEATAVNSAADLVSEASQGLAQEVERFLQGVTKDVEDRRRALRRPTSEPVTIRTLDGKEQTMQIVDVSSIGALVLGLDQYGIGQMITLNMVDGTEIQGRIVRQSDEGSGIEFVQPLNDGHALLAA